MSERFPSLSNIQHLTSRQLVGMNNDSKIDRTTLFHFYTKLYLHKNNYYKLANKFNCRNEPFLFCSMQKGIKLKTGNWNTFEKSVSDKNHFRIRWKSLISSVQNKTISRPVIEWVARNRFHSVNVQITIFSNKIVKRSLCWLQTQSQALY